MAVSTPTRESVKKAKDLMPGYSEAYRIAALIETKGGNLYKAAEEIHAAIDHEPKSALGYYQHALFLLYDMGDSPLALAEIDKALSLDPGDETLETARALILTWLGRCADAAEIYERLLEKLDARPRRWRITTLDQAAQCYRRWAERDSQLNEGELFRVHLDRGCRILEQALSSLDFDARTISGFTNIIENGIFWGIHARDEAYAVEYLQRFSDAMSPRRCRYFD